MSSALGEAARFSMQNGHGDHDNLLEHLRNELRRRKLVVNPPQPAAEEVSVAPPVIAPPSVVAPPEPPSRPVEKAGPARLEGARGALDRATAKNEKARGWPRFLRGLRRNQAAINESLVRAVRSIVEAAERLREKINFLDRRLSDQDILRKAEREQLAQFEQQLEQFRAEQVRGFEELKAHQIENARESQAQLRRQFEVYRATAAEHRRHHEALEKRVEEQSSQIKTEEQGRGELRNQITELRRRLDEERLYVAKLEEQFTGQTRFLEEHRRQLLDLGYKVIGYQSEIGARFERLAATQLAERKQLLELDSFVRAQEKQTIEEARQFADLSRRLAEQQEMADARWQKANEKNAGYAEILEAQRGEANELRERLRQTEEFVAAQQNQTADEERQFSEIQGSVQAQRTQNAELQTLVNEQAARLNEFTARLEEYQNDIGARYHLTSEEFGQAKQQLADLRAFVQSQQHQTVEEERQFRVQQEQLTDLRGRLEQWRAEISADSSRLAEVAALRSRVAAAQASFSIIREHLEKAGSQQTIQALAPTLNEELKKHEADSFYLAFENKFRGSFEEIKKRLRFYIPTIHAIRDTTGSATAVDLGCGRGEWLELLKEHGYQALGVDLNTCMIDECQSRGLKVQRGDALSYLRGLPAGTHSLVTGFHIVEHLPFDSLIDLFREAFRVLVPGGALILETPNPECRHVSDYSFYLDPTHRNPLPPELLVFCGNEVGFASVQVERLQPYIEEGVLQGYLDYAGIFTK